MRKLIALTISVFVLTINSCRKENIVDDTNYPPSGEDKYVYLNEKLNPYKFKTGSYWIYENETTAELDSVYVISTETDFFMWIPPLHGNGPAKFAEYYKINLISSLHSIDSTGYNDYLVFDYIKRNGHGYIDGQLMFTMDEHPGYDFLGMKIIANYPTMTINNHTFNNVTQTKITASEQYQPMFDHDTQLFFTDTIGLIKKVTDLGNGAFETWSIKRWSVLK